MTSLDLKVFVRYLVRDGERQFGQARQLMKLQTQERQLLHIPITMSSCDPAVRHSCSLMTLKVDLAAIGVTKHKFLTQSLQIRQLAINQQRVEACGQLGADSIERGEFKQSN
ncbi:hypothetical protein P3T18_003109 [Paraburkholderia sp. GAS199]|uniref:hypothetical protein n=1 Tax=Paraburkholderia sp. GAS199 TaxID=3035126 RepID=UPI003D1A8AA7